MARFFGLRVVDHPYDDDLTMPNGLRIEMTKILLKNLQIAIVFLFQSISALLVFDEVAQAREHSDAIAKPGAGGEISPSQSGMGASVATGKIDKQQSDLFDRSLHMAGEIDRQLRSETGAHFPAFADSSSYMRFHNNLEAGTIPRWTGIAQVAEGAMPGTGQQVYKISNGANSYCIRIPSPYIGIDRYEWERNNFHPITCPTINWENSAH